MFKRMKGFTLSQLPAVAIAFGVFVVVLGFMAQLLGDIQGQQTTDTYAYNITSKGLEGLMTFGNNTPLIASAVIIAVVIGIILVYLGAVSRRS